MANNQNSSSTRQKVTIIVFIVVLGLIGWQVKGLLSDSGGSTSSKMAANKTAAPTQNAMQAKIAAETPKPALLPKSVDISTREAEIARLQNTTQLKYLNALNELQVLRVNKDIAETNDAISKAHLSTVEAQKKIIDSINPPAPPPPPADVYSKSLANGAANKQVTQTTVEEQPAVRYTVISVSRVSDHWNAVLATKGSLYRVSIGDVLPPDGAKVVAINRNSVVLSRDNVSIKISLVPVI